MFSVEIIVTVLNNVSISLDLNYTYFINRII